jgi:hypothetical protein
MTNHAEMRGQRNHGVICSSPQDQAANYSGWHVTPDCTILGYAL